MSDEDLTRVSPAEAAEEYLAQRRLELADSTIGSYRRRLRTFVTWCADNDVDVLADVTPRDIRRYSLAQRGRDDLAPATVRNRLMTLRTLLEYCEGDLAPAGIADTVEVPNLSNEEQTDDTKLSTEQAEALLAYYREHYYGSRPHAVLALLWTVGCRRGGLRALDVEDFDRDESYLRFIHRPESDTPLKNQYNGQRVVGLAGWVTDVLADYIAGKRHRTRDRQGREPLITSPSGRPSVNTITQWVYDATLPCIFGPCPHGKEPETCEWAQHNHTSKCPSSRSPHQVRTGAITHMRDRGIPPEIVAERVNATPEVIRRFYDKPDAPQEVERMEQRRQYFDDINEP